MLMRMISGSFDDNSGDDDADAGDGGVGSDDEDLATIC